MQVINKLMRIFNLNGIDYFQCQGYFGDLVQIAISDIDYFGISYLDYDEPDLYPRLVTVVYTLPTGVHYLPRTLIDIRKFFALNGYRIESNGDVFKIGGDK